jgi:hypothetical protein
MARPSTTVSAFTYLLTHSLTTQVSNERFTCHTLRQNSHGPLSLQFSQSPMSSFCRQLCCWHCSGWRLCRIGLWVARHVVGPGMVIEGRWALWRRHRGDAGDVRPLLHRGGRWTHRGFCKAEPIGFRGPSHRICLRLIDLRGCIGGLHRAVCRGRCCWWMVPSSTNKDKDGSSHQSEEG